MPTYNINGIRVRDMQDHRAWFEQRNPQLLPKPIQPVKPKTPESHLYIQVLLIILVIAINLLSMAHTVPSVMQFYPKEVSSLVRAFVGIAGTIAIEGTIVILMSLERRGKPANAAIGVAFFAALVMNLMSTYIAVNEVGNQVSEQFSGVLAILLGGLVGLVPPVANLAIGETLHRYSIIRKDELESIERDFEEKTMERQQKYLEEVGAFEEKLRKNYQNYLKKMLTFPDAPQIIELIMSGDYFEDDYVAPVKPNIIEPDSFLNPQMN